MVGVDDINTNKCSFKSIKVGDRRWHVYQHVVNFLWSKISRNDTYTRIICDILGIEANGPLPPERHQSKYVHNSFTIRTTGSMPKAVNSSVQKRARYKNVQWFEGRCWFCPILKYAMRRKMKLYMQYHHRPFVVEAAAVVEEAAVAMEEEVVAENNIERPIRQLSSVSVF